jgi:hypothetical protein
VTVAEGDKATALIARSVVKPTARYEDYREFLRWDFWFSCAYCAITEIEACGIGFQIDHYEPQSVRRDLIADYSNLLWACGPCNRHKGGDCPSSEERAAGLRYFRPDLDDAYEHFEVAGLRLNGLTPVGTFTIEVLYLNRFALQEIRDLRRELFEAHHEILVGIRALLGVSIDQLNPVVRARFMQIRKRLERRAAAATAGDDLVREFNRSPLLDRDPDQLDLTKRRREWLAAQKALLPRVP